MRRIALQRLPVPRQKSSRRSPCRVMRIGPNIRRRGGRVSRDRMDTHTSRFAPPVPQALPENLPWWRSLIAFRVNVIATWPPSAYEDDIRVGGFLGRRWLLLNEPEAIRHVLVDNDRN